MLFLTIRKLENLNKQSQSGRNYSWNKTAFTKEWVSPNMSRPWNHKSVWSLWISQRSQRKPLETWQKPVSKAHATKSLTVGVFLTLSPFRMHKLNQLRTLASLSSSRPQTNATTPLTPATDDEGLSDNTTSWRSWRRVNAIARHGSLQCDTCRNAAKIHVNQIWHEDHI